MADDVKPAGIDPALLDEARAKGVDVDALIVRTLRRELASRWTQEEAAASRKAAADLVADCNERFDRDGAWAEAWRRWE